MLTEDGVDVVSAAGIAAVRGQLGAFEIELPDGSPTLAAGAIILAPAVPLNAEPPAGLSGLLTQPLADYAGSRPKDGDTESVALWLDPHGPTLIIGRVMFCFDGE